MKNLDIDKIWSEILRKCGYEKKIKCENIIIKIQKTHVEKMFSLESYLLFISTLIFKDFY